MNGTLATSPFARGFAISDRTLTRVAVVVWALLAVFLLHNFWTSVVTLRFNDPDDALRLVQVRDLLAGQGWFDLVQHRINPRDGIPMHWSRLVDLPIAATILLLRPVLGTALAEQVAVVLVPLLLLLTTFVLLVRLLRPIEDRRIALVALAVAPFMPSIYFQMVPGRIDHHGWQEVLTLIASIAVLTRGRVSAPVVAALAMAADMSISFEGAPYMALFGAIYAWDWIVSPRGERSAGNALLRYAVTVAVAGPVINLLTRGPSDFASAWCDAWSTPYMAATGAAALIVAGSVVTLSARAGWLGRTLALAAGGAVAAGVFLSIAPQCSRGPFADLGPLLTSVWYESVLEGLPITMQVPELASLLIGPAVVGLAGTALGWYRARGAERAWWTRLIVMVVAMVGLSLMVYRAMPSAHVLLVPGTAVLIVALWDRLRASANVVVRVLGSVLLIAPAPIMSDALAHSMFAATGWTEKEQSADKQIDADTRCLRAMAGSGLPAMPAMHVLAPLDLAPHLLLQSPHSVEASGHHRNRVAMERVIRTFMARPDVAVARARAMGARVIIMCGATGEAQTVAAISPDGLMAALRNGRAVPGLTRTYTQGPFGVWRIDPAPRAAPTAAAQ